MYVAVLKEPCISLGTHWFAFHWVRALCTWIGYANCLACISVMVSPTPTWRCWDGARDYLHAEQMLYLWALTLPCDGPSMLVQWTLSSPLGLTLASDKKHETAYNTDMVVFLHSRLQQGLQAPLFSRSSFKGHSCSNATSSQDSLSINTHTL